MNSILESVCLICNNIRTKTKHGVNFQDLLKAIRKEFKIHNFDITLRSKTQKFLLTEEFYVNAYYDADDDKAKLTPIEVILFHNFDKAHVWDEQHITELLIEVFDAVTHEYKHQRQSKRRNFVSYWLDSSHAGHFSEYLADPDEVDAYALSIAIELCRSLGKYRALRYLPKLTALSRLKFKNRFASSNLNAYVSQFHTLENPVLRLLAKKVYVRIQKIDTDCIFL